MFPHTYFPVPFFAPAYFPPVPDGVVPIPDNDVFLPAFWNSF